MNKKFLIITGGLLFLVLVIVSLPRFLPRGKRLSWKNVPDNPASKVCQKISQPEDAYSCLAIVNHKSDFCRKIKSATERNMCLAMTNKDISFCRKIQNQEPKKICYYELGFMVDNIGYCDELDNYEQCYFSFIYRLYWQERSAEIKAKYCEKFSQNAGGDLAFKDTCWALKNRDPSFCQGNENCLSFFKQPLSFCDHLKLKTKPDCLRDRALTAKDISICAKIKDDVNIRDNCYGSYSAHISPNISLCQKISDKMTKNMCYKEYAINISEK